LEFDNEGAAAGESGPSKARQHLNNVRRLPKMRASTPGNVRRDSGDARRPPKDTCRDLSDTRSRAGIAHQNPDSSGPNPATRVATQP